MTTLLRDVLVEALHGRIVSKQVQALAIRLPQELHPWRQNSTICAVLLVLATDRAQEKTVEEENT